MIRPSVPPAVRGTGYDSAPLVYAAGPVANADRAEHTRGLGLNDRRLLIRDEVVLLLHLTDQQVQQLINTRQLTPFFIAGEERFDSRDVYRLIESYMSTASRRP